MQAIVHSRYGPPDGLELRDIEKPAISDDAVLVRVHAAAVGKGDWLTVQGLPYVARLRYGPRNQSTPPFRASTWPGALTRSAAM
jgi:NADPH:quinone reductase-like Zn-dependent oxidoreductase